MAGKKAKRRRNLYIGAAVFVGLVVLFALIRNTSLVPIPTTMTIKTENGNTVKIHAESEYRFKNGCDPDAECGNKNACSVKATQIGTEDSCPITQCQGTGFRNCDGSVWRDRCQHGKECNQNDRDCIVKGECEWITYTFSGTSGGVNYDEADACAWYVEVFDKDGDLLKEFSARTENEIWQESNHPQFTKQLHEKVGTVQIDYVDSFFGKGECLQQKWKIRDGTELIEVCIGNDADDKDCDQVIKRSCSLICPTTQILNEEECACQNIPPQNDNDDEDNDDTTAPPPQNDNDIPNEDQEEPPNHDDDTPNEQPSPGKGDDPSEISLFNPIVVITISTGIVMIGIFLYFRNKTNGKKKKKR